MKIVINGKTVDIADADLQKAIEEKKESIEVKSDDFVLRTKEEDSTYSENLRKEGITVGAEIGRKEVVKGLGIEAEGVHKSDKSTIDAINGIINSKVTTSLEEAKIEPNKKVETLTKDIELLRGNIDSLTREKEEVSNTFNSYKKNQKITEGLLKLIPDNTIIPKDEVLYLMKNRIKVDADENGNLIGLGADGQPLKDKTTLAPLNINKVVEGFFSENPHYLSGATGGAGGKDSKPSSTKKTWAQFETEQKEKGHTLNSPEYLADMEKETEAGLIE